MCASLMMTVADLCPRKFSSFRLKCETSLADAKRLSSAVASCLDCTPRVQLSVSNCVRTGDVKRRSENRLTGNAVFVRDRFMSKKQKLNRDEAETVGLSRGPSIGTRMLGEVRGTLMVFGPVVAIVLVIGFIYYPLAHENHWGPVERASCVSEIDGERAAASFDRSGSYYRLRGGSDAGKTVSPRAGTIDWECLRDKTGS
jgi:hypothetical protein